MNRLVVSLTLASLWVPSAALGQFVVEGVVHSAGDLSPLAGVTLFLVDDTTGQLVSPGQLAEPAQQGQITGADGRYTFSINTTQAVRLTLERDDARFIFPSVTRPPQGAAPLGDLACRDIPCPNGAISDATEPVAGVPYALRFLPTFANSARNNHLPVDSVPELVQVALSGDRAQLGRGEILWLEAAVFSQTSISEAELVLALPPGFRLAGPARLVLNRNDGTSETVAVEPRQRDLFLRLPLTLLSGEAARISVPVRLVRLTTVEARFRATVFLSGGILGSNESALTVRTEEDPTLGQSTILGRVYCESGGRPDWQDPGDPGLYGARVYLDTGFYADTDPEGRFHFSGVPPGTRYLKLDPASLPPNSPIVGSGRAQLYLSPGTPAQVRFGVACRWDRWDRPKEVLRAPIARSEPLEPATATVAMLLDSKQGRLLLGQRDERYLTAGLRAHWQGQGVRFWPTVGGEYSVSNWSLTLERVTPNGVETVGGPKGAGSPPLFVDVPLTPGTYRARLQLRSGETDRARSRLVQISYSPPPVPPQPLATLTFGSSLEQQLSGLTWDSSRPLGVVAHWDSLSGPDAAKSEADLWLKQALAALQRAGAPLARLRPRNAGDTEPLVPNLSPRVARKNRRIELVWLNEPASESEPELPKPATAALVIGADGQEQTVPLDGPLTSILEVEPPAPLTLTIRDGLGGESWLLRGVDRHFVMRSGERAHQVVQVTSGRLVAGAFEKVLPQPTTWISQIEAFRQDQRARLRLVTQTRGASDPLVRWRVVVSAGTLRLGEWAEAGALAPEIELTVSATVATSLQVQLSTEHASGARFVLPAAQVVLPEGSPLELRLTPQALVRMDTLSPVQNALSASDQASLTIRLGGGSAKERARWRTKLTAALAGRDITWIEDGAGPLTLSFSIQNRNVATFSEPRLSTQTRRQGWQEEADSIPLSGRILQLGGDTQLTLEVPELEGLPPETPPVRKESPVQTDFPPTEAESLLLQVPQDVPLQRWTLPLVGFTRPDNRVMIAGQTIPVRSDGRFEVTVPLAAGTNRVRVESADPAGNVAVFERTVTTSSSGWFLMALGEGQLSLGGARLAGANSHTGGALGEVALDGRLVAFGRARWVVPGPFRRLSLVGRVDTAERVGSQVRRLSDDPLRLLPAFGDGSLEVQATSTRHKIYLGLQADDSRLVVGNSSTSLDLLGHRGAFQYRRAGFGAHLHLDLVHGDSAKSEVRALVAGGNEGTARGHDELLGTGGAFYWLSRRDVVEGSERVVLTVRDRDTGQILSQRLLVPGEDYEIRTREGRITTRQIIPSTSGQATTALNRSVPLGGHPIFLVVDYEYLRDATDDLAFGATAKETLFGQLELFAGVAGENRTDGNYRLYGAGLAWRPTRSSFFELEYARSEGQTTFGALSVDGGLRFFDLNRRTALLEQNLREPFAGATAPDVWSASGNVALRDLSSLDGSVRFSLRRTGSNFVSLQSARDAGRFEGGLGARVKVAENVAIFGSFDAASTLLAQSVAGPGAPTVSSMFRGLAVLGGDWRQGPDAVSAEVAHLFTRASGLAGSSVTGASARYERRITPELSLSLAQDLLFDDDAYTPGGLGATGTTVGARYVLSSNLTLFAAQLLRWNGDNASQLGFEVAADELRTYVAQRFSHAGESRWASVLGVEDQVAPGSRTYGELQMDALHAQQMRAVIGMDNRWLLLKGLELQLSYERAQLTQGARVLSAAEPIPYFGNLGGLVPTLGGFGGVLQLLPGALSRDALAAGATWSPTAALRLSSRFEFRRDDGEARDYLAYAYHGGAAWQVHREVSLIGRLSWQQVDDTTLDQPFARALESSLAAIYRPIGADWLNVLLRYTRVSAQRPWSDTSQPRRHELRDAFSLEPIFDTPWRVQLAERIALVRAQTRLGADEAGGLNVLWINRINGRPLTQLELGFEYRMLLDLAADTAERGFLAEVGWVPDDRLRVGIGYNFSRFSDDILVLASESVGGPFFRVTARY